MGTVCPGEHKPQHHDESKVFSLCINGGSCSVELCAKNRLHPCHNCNNSCWSNSTFPNSCSGHRNSCSWSSCQGQGSSCCCLDCQKQRKEVCWTFHPEPGGSGVSGQGLHTGHVQPVKMGYRKGTL